MLEFKIDIDEYPMLKNFKKKELDIFIQKIFNTGYNIHFPSNDNIIKQIELKEVSTKIEQIKLDLTQEINKTDIASKLTLLENSLSRLIGISNNSYKKGDFGENMLEEIFTQRYGDILFEKKNHIPHSGDAWLILPNNIKIMLEIKNYTNTVNKEEINKLEYDMKYNNINWAIMVSFNSNIFQTRELDFHTFTHNNEIYSIIMISNLTNDIHKLDLGLMIIRKLIINYNKNFNNAIQNIIINDINDSLDKLNQIAKKNYLLRDNYYNMEREITKSLSSYHVIMRDYMYDMEKIIEQLINKLQNIKIDDIKIIDNKYILNKYNDKKIIHLLTRLLDLAEKKKWIIQETDNDTFIIVDIGFIKIQQKKILLSTNNDITFTLNLGKDKENLENLEYINKL
jgi:hypothetical protein